MEGIRALENDWTETLRQRDALVVVGCNEARLRLREITQTAEKSSDLAEVIVQCDKLREDVLRHSTTTPDNGAVVYYSSICVISGR